MKFMKLSAREDLEWSLFYLKIYGKTAFPSMRQFIGIIKLIQLNS